MKIVAIVLSLILAPIFSSAQPNTDNPSLVVHLLDYLAKDYGGAVQNGKIISQSEFNEQVEFSETVLNVTKNVDKLKSDSEFVKSVTHLQALINNKASENEVASLARSLQQQAIRLAQIEVAPRKWPDQKRGENLFKNNCVTCHGATGHGDGIAAAGLDPKPANFHDKEVIWGSSPFKFYNTIRLGVPGTGMTPFSQLSDEDIWSLAFYLKSLGYQNVAEVVTDTKLNLKEIASLSDEEIAKQFGLNGKEAVGVLATIRNSSIRAQEQKSPLVIAQEFMNKSFELAKAKDFSKAKSLALRAYLEGIEPVEPKIKANIPGGVEKIEGLMSRYRSSLSKSESIATIGALKEKIDISIKDIRKQLAEEKMSPSVAFGAAFSIFLREGFEAVLLIIILISILNAMKQPEAIRWVHIGWSMAVGTGIFLWFLSGIVIAMSGVSREFMEGSISLIAVAVLIYVGFWLHRYTEVKKWHAFLEKKLKEGLSQKSYLALAAVAFIAVFREAFEVVLFLRAIWFDLDTSGQNIASLGVLSSFVVLIGFSYLAVKESQKLSMKLLFQVCSWTMMVLAFILAGKGIHSLQEAGLCSVSIVSFIPRFDIVGIFPTIETIGVQLLAIAIFGFLLFSEKFMQAQESRI